MFMVVSKVSVIGVLFPLLLMNFILNAIVTVAIDAFDNEGFMLVVLFGSLIETGVLFGVMWLAEHVQIV